jgi:hypothetical protein
MAGFISVGLEVFLGGQWSTWLKATLIFLRNLEEEVGPFFPCGLVVFTEPITTAETVKTTKYPLR